jgi:hypothetical protein
VIGKKVAGSREGAGSWEECPRFSYREEDGRWPRGRGNGNPESSFPVIGKEVARAFPVIGKEVAGGREEGGN